MNKTILILSLFVSCFAFAQSDTIINKVKEIDDLPISEFNKIDEKTHLISVKFRDASLRNSMVMVPERREMGKELVLIGDSRTAEKFNLTTSKRDRALNILAQIYDDTGYMLKHIRSNSLGYERFSVKTNDIDSVIEKLESTGFFEHVSVEKRVTINERIVKPIPNDFSTQGIDFSGINDTYAKRQGYLDIQQDYSMGSHGFIEAEKYAEENNNLGRKVRIAVIDTGYFPHEDIDPIVEGKDFVSFSFYKNCLSEDSTNTGLDATCPAEDMVDQERDDNPIDKGWLVESDGSGTIEIDGHGLAVASTIAAVNNNAKGIYGAVGNDNVDIVHIRGLGIDGGLNTDIADAIVWASGGEVPGFENIQERVDIINLSLGALNDCSLIGYFNDAVDFARSQGVVVVAASGNNAVNVEGFAPGGCDNVLTVAANTNTGDITLFSNYGDKVEVSFTGEDIYAANINEVGYITPEDGSCTDEDGEAANDQCYGVVSGTSFAAPLASSAVALIKMVRPQLSESELRALITTTAGSYKVNEVGRETLRAELLPYAGVGNVYQAILSNYDKFVIENLDINHQFLGFNDQFGTKYLNGLIQETGDAQSVCSLYNLSWGNFRDEVEGVTYTIYGANGLAQDEPMTASNSEVIVRDLVTTDMVINVRNYQKIGVQSLDGDIYEFDFDTAQVPSTCL